jgi:ribosomal protein L11 methylase PrmA
MKHGALLLVSGFFTPDLDDIKTCFSAQGLQFVSAADREGWCCATFRKP